MQRNELFYFSASGNAMDLSQWPADIKAALLQKGYFRTKVSAMDFTNNLLKAQIKDNKTGNQG